MSLVDSLAHTPVFAHFPRADLETLTTTMREVYFPGGYTILSQGERGRAVYVLLSGECYVERRVPGSAARARIAQLTPGSLVGALSVIDGQPRMASCIAASDTHLAEITSDDFGILMNANTPLGTRFQHAVARSLIRDLRQTDQRIAELAGLERVDPERLLRGVGAWT